MERNQGSGGNVLPELECACASIRRAARLVTQLYSDEMRRHLEPTQFSLLSALNGRPGVPQAAVGRALGLDKTTMSRNLRLMEKKGWIEPLFTDDHRERGFRLTPSGERVLEATKPGWMRAQARLRAALKGEKWDSMMKTIDDMAAAALKLQGTSDGG